MPLILLQSARARFRMVRDWLAELRRNGVPRETGDPANGTVFLIDGVGGFLLTPTLARVALRQAGADFATCLFDWHRGPRGEMLADLTCLRANRRAALRLARIIRRRIREFPNAPVHVLSYSGGTGIAVFAAEKLGRSARIDVLVLAASALSPDYPLTAALRHVRTCYALTSRRDFALLGLGTTLFGTVDRRFGCAAGLRGFRYAGDARGAGDSADDGRGPDQGPAAGDDKAAGDAGRFLELPWQPDMSRLGHTGHHTGAACVPFIRERIVPLLAARRARGR